MYIYIYNICVVIEVILHLLGDYCHPSHIGFILRVVEQVQSENGLVHPIPHIWGCP